MNRRQQIVPQTSSPTNPKWTQADTVNAIIYGFWHMSKERGELNPNPEKDPMVEEAFYHLDLGHKAELSGNTERYTFHYRMFQEYLLKRSNVQEPVEDWQI